MINKKVILATILISMIVFCTRALAQDDSTHLKGWLRIDHKLRERYEKTNYDTMYIVRPKELINLRFRGNFSGTDIRTRERIDGTTIRGHLQADYQNSISVDIGYCGLTVGLTLNPASLSGKNKDTEFNLNYYDNRFGFDVVYETVKSFRGHVNYQGERLDLTKRDLNMHMLNVNAYYVFNGKRFSYPAAFDHTYIQKRSAGSWLAGIAYQSGRLRSEANEGANLPKTRLYLGHIAVGGGYAYNWVAHRRWLIHASALPYLIVSNRSNIRIDDERHDTRTRFPDFIISSRLAVVRTFGRYYASISGVMTSTLIGDNNVMTDFNKWYSQAVFGMRF